jgi:hypothetical protein
MNKIRIKENEKKGKDRKENNRKKRRKFKKRKKKFNLLRMILWAKSIRTASMYDSSVRRERSLAFFIKRYFVLLLEIVRIFFA